MTKPSLRPEQDKIYDLGSGARRWGKLFVGQIDLDENLTTNSNILITTGSYTLNVGQKILELSSSLGTGNGTVKSINDIQPNVSGNISLGVNQLSSSYSPINYSTGSSQTGLDRHLYGIDQKLNSIFYTNTNNIISGENTFNGSTILKAGLAKITGTIPSNSSDASIVTSKWVSDKLGNLSGALTFKGEVTTADTKLYSASLGDVYILSETGYIASQSVIKGNLIIFKSASIDTNTITSSSFNIVDNSPGVFIVNGRTGNQIALTTGDIGEGASSLGGAAKLWYTDYRSRSAISVTGSYISYDSGSGVISSSLTDSVIRSKITVTGSGLSYDSSTGLITLGVASFSSSSIRNLFSTTGSYISYDSGSGVISSSLDDLMIRSKITVTGSGLSYNSSTGVISASVSTSDIRGLLSVTGSGLTYDSGSGVISSSLTNSTYRNAISVTGSYINYESGSGVISSSLTDSIIRNVAAYSLDNPINQGPGAPINFTYDSITQKFAINSEAISSINSISLADSPIMPGDLILTTDNIDEGESNLYFTDARAISASIVDSVAGNETYKAPSVNSIKSYIATQITSSSKSDADIRNLISSSDSYISYNKDTGIISSSILNSFIPRSLISSANGIASLGANGKIPSDQLSPLAITNVDVVATTAAMKNLISSTGDVAIVTGNSSKYIYKSGSTAGLDGTGWLSLTTSDAVSSVNGFSGNITLTTNHISESQGNLYYTNDRSRSAISTTGNYISYNTGSGIISSSLTDSVIRSKITVTGSGLSYDSSTGVISASVSTNNIRSLFSTTGSYISYDSGSGVISSSLTDSVIRSKIAVAGDYISYNTGSGVISSLLTTSSIKDISQVLFSGGNHNGITFTYDNATKLISASVTSSGKVDTVNSITPDSSTKNILLTSKNIDSIFSPANYSKVNAESGLDLHFKGIDDKLGSVVLQSANNIFTGENTFGKITIAAQSELNAILARNVFVPTISDNYSSATTNQAINKEYLIGYTNSIADGYFKISDNLLGIINKAVARTNLGLGTAAILNAGTSDGTIPVLNSLGLPAVSGSSLISLPSISKCSDVTITSASNGQVLQYDGTKWINSAISLPVPSIEKIDLPYYTGNPLVLTDYIVSFTSSEVEKTILLNPNQNYMECFIPKSETSTKGKKIHLKNIYPSAAYTIIIRNKDNPINKIDGQDFIQISQRYTCVTLQADGLGNWWII